MEERTKQKEETGALSKQKSRRKWLGRLGHFLMYGGWILLAAVIIGLVILFSPAT